MKAIFQWIGFILLSVSVSDAQNVYQPFIKQNTVPENLKMSLQKSIDQYQLLSIDFNVVDLLIKNRPSTIRMEIPITSESSVVYDMERYDILAPGAQFVAGTDLGDVPQKTQPGIVSYKIRWTDHLRPLAIINFSDHYINGVFEYNGDTYEIGALNGFKNSSVKDYIIYPVSRLKAHSDFTCETGDDHLDHQLSDKISMIKAQKPFDVETSDLLVCNVAVEMDYQAYQYYGSAENATAYILSLFATSSAIYNRDINTMFNVTFVRVWTTSSDPYTDSPSGSSTLLTEFRNYWNANMRHVPRTIAHYSSPRNQGLGGIAWVNALCSSINSGYGYGFSDIQNTSSITPLPSYTWQVMVVTHEIGHNYGSPHTHSCYWDPPIDTCYFGSETQSCVTGTGCTLDNVCIPRVGTIMSYCHLTIMGSILYFGPLPSELIRSYAESAVCMTVHERPLRLGQPNGHEVYTTKSSRTSANPTTVITWGSNLEENVKLQFSPDSGTTWQTIAENIPWTTAREYTWSIPYIQTTHNALVRIAQNNDETIADTSDTPFSIKLKLWTFQNLNPPINTTIFVDSGDYTPYNFSWNRSADISGVLYKWYVKKRTGTVPTAIFIANNNGQDTTITLTAHQIDSAVTSWGLWNGDSIQCHWYGVAFNDPDTQRVDLRFNITFRKSPQIDVTATDKKLPADCFLYSAYPNPFNPVTTIKYSLPENTLVKIRIYNALGQEIKTLIQSFQSKGLHSVNWDGTNHNGMKVSSGIYVYTLETDKVIRVRKMTLLK